MKTLAVLMLIASSGCATGKIAFRDWSGSIGPLPIGSDYSLTVSKSPCAPDAVVGATVTAPEGAYTCSVPVPCPKP